MNAEGHRQLIKDKYGSQYMQLTYNDAQCLIVKLLHQDKEVGKIQCVFNSSGEMLIGDLIVHNGVVHFSNNGWPQFWQTIFKPKPINYRQRGLGTHLLDFAINYARQIKIKHIHGALVQEDINNTRGLTSWYKKHGFTIDRPTSEDIPSAVARISMDLR